MSTINTVTEQLTRAGQAIEHDSFAIIDAEVQAHSYTAEQWPIVRRMIHANADFDFNGLTDFHPQAVHAGITAMLRGGTPVVAAELGPFAAAMGAAALAAEAGAVT